MPNRMLKERIKTSTEIDHLSWFEEVVFYRMIVTADDYGCLDGREIVLKNELFPTKECVTKKSICDAIDKLERENLLVRYEVEGKPYICLTTWEEHQRLRNKNRKYPKPPFDRRLSADCGQLSADCGQLSADCHDELELEVELELKKNKKKKFEPPTIDEIVRYCAERGNNVDPKRFFDYYNAAGWKDGKGDPVRNWKQKIIAVWEKDDKSPPRMPVYDASGNKKISDEEADELLKLMGKEGRHDNA